MTVRIPTDYERLVRFLRAPVRRFGLAIARSNDRRELERVLGQATVDAEQAKIKLATVQVAPGQDLLAEMSSAVAGAGGEGAEVLFVRGLDALLLDDLGGMRVDPAIERWNRARDRLPIEVPARTVLWLTDAASHALGQAARDLFDVVMTTFVFDSPVDILDAAGIPGLREKKPSDAQRDQFLREAALLRESLASAAPESHQFAETQLRLALIASELECFDDARAAAQSALGTLERLSDGPGVATAHLVLSVAHVAGGDLDAAEGEARLAAQGFQAIGDVVRFAVAQGLVATYLFLSGQAEQAGRLLQQETLPIVERAGDVQARAQMLQLIERLTSGRTFEAEQLRRGAGPGSDDPVT